MFGVVFDFSQILNRIRSLSELDLSSLLQYYHDNVFKSMFLVAIILKLRQILLEALGLWTPLTILNLLRGNNGSHQRVMLVSLEAVCLNIFAS